MAIKKTAAKKAAPKKVKKTAAKKTAPKKAKKTAAAAPATQHPAVARIKNGTMF